MACYRYIEMNPVRAGMVESPGDYPWSSYRHNAESAPSDWLIHHSQYEGLAETGEQRCDAYRKLFDSHLDPDTLSDVRRCLQTGTPLGDDRFRARIEAVLKVKVGYSSRGRPRKADDIVKVGSMAHIITHKSPTTKTKEI
jgi:putative transposase